MKWPDEGGSGFAVASAVVAMMALVGFFYAAPVFGWPLVLGVSAGCVLGIGLIVFGRKG